jgi:tight adherence protein B
MALQAQVDNGVGDLEQEFAIVLREQRVGLRMEDAMENLAERINSEEVDLMVSAVSIAQDLGGNLAETLQSLSDTIRQKMDMEGKINSLTAQGRLQGYIVSALPFLMLLGFAFFEPDSTMPIFTSLLGWIVLALILTMQLIGGSLIRKLVSIDI